MQVVVVEMGVFDVVGGGVALVGVVEVVVVDGDLGGDVGGPAWDDINHNYSCFLRDGELCTYQFRRLCCGHAGCCKRR